MGQEFDESYYSELATSDDASTYGESSAMGPFSGLYRSDPLFRSAHRSAMAYPHSPFDSGLVQLDSPLFSEMLNFQNRQGDKEIAILESNPWGFQGPQLLVGGQMRGSLLGAFTNQTNKFGYLGRFPTDFEGDSATDARILQGQLAGLARIAPVASVYFETLYSDTFSFPTADQGSFQMRQFYGVIGDFTVSPFYAYLGKKNLSFGDMSTLSPFSQAMTWHYFSGLGEGVGIGYSDRGLNVTISALNGSRGIRVIDSERKGSLNNFAFNGIYTGELSSEFAYSMGAGYLMGTIYNANVAEHTDAAVFGANNGAWDVNGALRVGRALIAGEVVQTERLWPTTGAKVSAWRIESAYDLRWAKPTRASISWSSGSQGPTGSQFEFNRQLALGFSRYWHPQVMISAEYVRSIGFAPLMNITTASDRSVRQNSLVLGLTATF